MYAIMFAAALAAVVPQQPLDRVSAAILAEHNLARAQAGVPPLRWNWQLAADAAAYGPVLSAIGHLQHSPRSSRPRNERENLVQGPRGLYSPAQLVDVWIAERRYFHPGIFPNVCAGDWSLCAHYTQMIWPTTTDVGCAIYTDRRYDWMICRYSPPGNADGKPVGYRVSAASNRR
jgi:hypothetical protein